MSQVCERCGMPVRAGFKFCNVCGAPLEEKSSESIQVAGYSEFLGVKGRALRIMTGERAGEFVAAYPTCTIGRENADITLAEDATLSPSHARLSVRQNATILEDLDSLNGVFLKASDKLVLQDNDVIRAGDHYFLFEFFSSDKFIDDTGTEFYAAPNRGERFRLVEILENGRRGRACMAPDGGIVVGTSEGDFLFPEDDKMSRRHFTLRWTQRGGLLIDHSDNGTFVQIHEATPVAEGDIFFAGKTLFRVV